MKSGNSLFASSALVVAAVGSMYSSVGAAQQSTEGAREPAVKVYVGADAIHKEMEVLEQVIANTATGIVAGKAESDELRQLLSRKASLREQLASPQLAAKDFQLQSLSGCGQSLQLSVNAIATGGGGAYANAYGLVQLNASQPALVQGVVYSIVKNFYETESQFRTFSFHSLKQPAGSYSASSNSGAEGSWSSCGKAYATGVISDLSGNTLACGTVPLIIETQYQTGAFFDCSSAL